MRNLSKVYHVGDLSVSEPAVFRAAGESYEGNGLSVSVHPEAWEEIAELGGQKTFVLEKDHPNFLNAHDEALRKAALEWCLENGFVEEHLWWRTYGISERDDEYFEFPDRASALAEANSADDVKSVIGYVIAGAMVDYFAEGMSPPHIYAEDYAVIWFAKGLALTASGGRRSIRLQNSLRPAG